MAKTVKYYNFLVKITARDADECRSIAGDIDGWLSDYMADDNSYGDGSIQYELVRFSERKKKKRKIK